MGGMPWFRLYAEMIDDPKIGRLNDAQFRLWIEILCLACKGENGNTLQTIDDINWSLRRNVTETLRELLHETLVKLDSENRVFVTNWEKRQFNSDNSTDRVRKYRERKKKDKGNVTETLPKRKCNGIDKIRTDTDKSRGDKKTKTALPNDFLITQEMSDWFDNQNFTIDMNSATETWKDAMKSKGMKYVDWAATWRNGMKMAQKWREEHSSKVAPFDQNRPRKEFGA